MMLLTMHLKFGPLDLNLLLSTILYSTLFLFPLQDLDFLSSGLEGRSSNPVGLLFDHLTHPDADLGLESPSLLRWEHHPEKSIKHVVLGKKEIGGAWQVGKNYFYFSRTFSYCMYSLIYMMAQ